MLGSKLIIFGKIFDIDPKLLWPLYFALATEIVITGRSSFTPRHLHFQYGSKTLAKYCVNFVGIEKEQALRPPKLSSYYSARPNTRPPTKHGPQLLMQREKHFQSNFAWRNYYDCLWCGRQPSSYHRCCSRTRVSLGCIPWIGHCYWYRQSLHYVHTRSRMRSVS